LKLLDNGTMHQPDDSNSQQSTALTHLDGIKLLPDVLLKALLDTPTGIAVIDRDLRYIVFNRALAAMNGSDPEAFIGKTVREVVPHLADALEPAMMQVLTTGAALEHLEVIGSGADEGRTWLEHLQPLKDDAGQTLAVLVTIQEITRVREADRASRNSEVRLQRALEASRAGIWEYDPETRDITYDGLYGVFIGREAGPGRINAAQLEAFMPREEQRHAFEPVARALAAGEGAKFHAEYLLRVPGQAERWIGTRGRVERTPDGAFRLVGTLQDITERREFEARAERTLERLELTLEASGIGLWDWDVTTNRVHWSAEQERLYGLEPGSFSGRLEDFEAFMDPEDTQHNKADAASLERGESTSRSFRITRHDGQTRWIHAISRPTLDEGGRLLRVMGANLDVTKLKQVETRLLEINEGQRRFVGDAAHELRTPLTAIRGNLSLLARYPNMPEEERFIAIKEADQEATRLSRLVADLLAVARGDVQEIRVFEEIALQDVLEEAWQAAQASSDQHRFELGTIQPLRVNGNKDALCQLLLILFKNAINYTAPGGRIRLEAELRDGCAEVRIIDTGTGITAEDLPHVFERFYRSDTSRSKADSIGGHGLGLTIAQRIAESHGGSIRLESAVGVGTTAVLRLPVLAP
jgi:PAS domain S-box-containing protein